MLSKYKWGIRAVSALTLCCAIAIARPIQAEDTIATAASIDKAPYSQVFYTGSVYAVRDHDYRGSDPAIGVSTLWSRNPAEDNLSVGVRYCVPQSDLIGSNTLLTKLVLSNNNQLLVTIDQSVAETPSYQRVVRDATTASEFGFWDPGAYWGDDDFWNGFDDDFWIDDATSPPVVCTAGSSRFNITPLASTIAQLPPETLQMTLIFSNGVTSQWKLGQKTVQALKGLLALPQSSPTASQGP